MLNIACPHCQAAMKLSQPKEGKFSPTCRSCKMKFRLTIKQMSDGSFRFKTSPIEKQPTRKVTSSPADETALDTNQQPRDKATTQNFAATVTHDFQKTEKPIGTRAADRDHDKTVAATNAGRLKSALKSGRLGAYRLIRTLGEGGMGTVFLANQMSLDRNVALKVIRSKLADNPAILARFTREAYAAAQLVHPNVVQIYDMGADQGNSFFSMELVDGKSLNEIVRQKKRLDPQEATSYILHAARGLKCAHDAGMVHRDIKPANLLVNQDGLVKVADLGLVKVPHHDDSDDEPSVASKSHSQHLTHVGSTIGTPYYMAPEQTKTSAVDHRADIYSLGCTYYVLLTGKKPFEGSSMDEVASKHTNEPLVLPSTLVQRVPDELSAIVSQMMAKRPEDRYQNLKELIADLESFLGISSAGSFTPEEEDATTIESASKSFRAPSQVKLRRVLPAALFAASLLLSLLTLFSSWRLASGFLLMPLSAVAAYIITHGLNRESALLIKLRELLFRSGILAWLKWIAASILLIIASFVVGTFAYWLLLGIVGVGLGVGFYYLIDVPLLKARIPSIDRARQVIRRMRIKGVDEPTIETFVAKYADEHWEEFFEQLFGYAAKRRIRKELSKSDAGVRKKKYSTWRDSIIDRIDERLENLNTIKDRKHLQTVEQAGLLADGCSASAAKAQAVQMADAIVDHGDSIRIALLEQRLRDVDPRFQRMQRRNRVKKMLADARNGKYRKERRIGALIAGLLNGILGSYPRFLIGCCLIVGCLMWAKQNDLLLSVEQIAEFGQQGATAISQQVSGTTENSASETVTMLEKKANDLKDSANRPTKPYFTIFKSFDALIAGLVLGISAITFGWRISLFVIPAALVALFGSQFGIPELIPLEVPHLNRTTSVIAIALLVAGIIFGRDS